MHITRAAFAAVPFVFTAAVGATVGALGAGADSVRGAVIALLPAAGLWYGLPLLLTGRQSGLLRRPAVWAAVTAALLGCAALAAVCYGYFFAFLLVPPLAVCAALTAVGCVVLHRGHRWGAALATVPAAVLSGAGLFAAGGTSLVATAVTAAVLLLVPAVLTVITGLRRGPVASS